MTGLKTAAGIVAAIFLLGTVPATAFAAELARARVAANVRAAPSVESERLSVLKAGQAVRILSESEDGEWVYVTDILERDLGYVAERLLERNVADFARPDSVFARAVRSGQVDEMQERNRRRKEAEEKRREEEWVARVNAEDAARQERDRISAEEFERRHEEYMAWALQSEDYSGRRGGDALDNLANSMVSQLQTMQNDLAWQQRQQMLRQQQQQLIQQQRQQQQTYTRPNTHGGQPTQTARPSWGGGNTGGGRIPSSPSVTPARSNQCWYTPDPPQPSCVAESTQWDDGRFLIRSRNVCNKRIVVRACGVRRNTGEYCGMSGVGPGSTWTHLVGESMNPTGGYRVEWAGSENSVEDWTCISRG